MHANMFRGAATDEEVYAALTRDTERDSKSIRWMDFILVVAAIYLVRGMPTWDLVAALLLGFVGMQRLSFFIDQSNRNFFMHMLDWQQARDRPASSRGGR